VQLTVRVYMILLRVDLHVGGTACWGLRKLLTGKHALKDFVTD
jgi:hypothetical protein